MRHYPKSRSVVRSYFGYTRPDCIQDRECIQLDSLAVAPDFRREIFPRAFRAKLAWDLPRTFRTPRIFPSRCASAGGFAPITSGPSGGRVRAVSRQQGQRPNLETGAQTANSVSLQAMPLSAYPACRYRRACSGRPSERIPCACRSWASLPKTHGGRPAAYPVSIVRITIGIQRAHLSFSLASSIQGLGNPLTRQSSPAHIRFSVRNR
jgi:hypothetical protein